VCVLCVQNPILETRMISEALYKDVLLDSLSSCSGKMVWGGGQRNRITISEKFTHIG